MTMELPGAFAANDPFASASAPAPAPAPAAAPPAPEIPLKIGSLVKVKDGRVAVVVAMGPAPRMQTAPDGSSSLVDLPGYVLAFFAGAIESPHTAGELGLQAL